MSSTTKFRALHENTTPLLLPNVWDAGSARVFEDLGAAAVATTSAGVAWSLGYQDVRAVPINEIIALAFRISRVVSVPISIDIENGYSDDPKVVANNVMRLADWGIAGINLEDGDDAPALVARKIEAIRTALEKAGYDMFLNIRSDVMLAGLVEPARQVEESVGRGEYYAAAGADGFFLPAVVRPEDIALIASEVPLPLNVLSVPGLPDAAELGKLGVSRLSAGSGIAQKVWGDTEELVSNFLKTGHSEPLFSNAMGYQQLQGLFSK